MSSTNKIESRLSNKICPEGMSIEDWQIALRRENAREARFAVEHLDDNRIWGDYLVSSSSGRYRTAFRGVCSDRNFCSCLDFRTNGLGTCKHLEAVVIYLQERVPGYPWAGMTYNPPYTSVYVSYKGGRSIRMRIGSEQTEAFLKLYQQYFDADGSLPEHHYTELKRISEAGLAISPSFRLYEDVYEYANEQLQTIRLREELVATFPEERIPWDREHLSDRHEPLERMLYSLCYGCYGLIVGDRHPLFMHLVARLAEEVYQGVEKPQTGYIVVDSEADLRQWRAALASYEELQQLPVSVLTNAQFVALVGNDYTAATFVYVDNANGLKNWQNNVSLAIKKLNIDHLYMRIDTLRSLTPVQLSSILQHISPFVIGPFYKFIHQYRPIFPLQDDGANMPVEAKPLIYLCSRLPQQVEPAVSLSLMTETKQRLSTTSEDKVEALLRALIEVASDADALTLLKKRLS